MTVTPTPPRTPIPITLLGATGLTGSATLHALLLSRSIPFSITTLTRSEPKIPIPLLSETTHIKRIHPDLFEAVAGSGTESIGTAGGVYVTCLGTTRAQAGSFEAQRRVDLALNRELAKRARADGCTTVCLFLSARQYLVIFPLAVILGQELGSWSSGMLEVVSCRIGETNRHLASHYADFPY